MTSVEQVQCPNCAAQVDVEEGRSFLHCSYCGSGLKIEKGSSGHSMAVLDDIKVDTGILAHEVVRRRLEGRLGELEETFGVVHQRYDEGKPGGVWIMWIVALLFMGVTSLGFGFLKYKGASGEIIITGIAFILVGVVVLSIQSDKRQKMQEEYEAARERYESEVAAVREELEHVTEQMDDLTRKL